MELLFKILLALHVVSGSSGLLAGSYVIIARKGDKTHKLLGKIFACSILGAGFCSLALALIHPNQFLFTVGVFTIYMATTGWRYLYLRDIDTGQMPRVIDWILMIAMSWFGIFFLVLGAFALTRGDTFGFVPIIFGLVGIRFAYSDYCIYRGKSKYKNYWLLCHLQRMTGAYIASLTAFIVVNAPQTLGIVAWLTPAAILVPFIFIWSRKHKIEIIHLDR